MIYEIWKDWDQSREWLLPSLDMCCTHNEDDVLILLSTGKMNLWVGERSAIVTEVLEYPRGNVLNFFLAGGDLEDLKTLKNQAEKWGRQNGCFMAEGIGRDGWSSLEDYMPGGSRQVKELM